MDLRKIESVNERRSHLEKTLGINLDEIGQALSGISGPINCENLIGATILPLGVAGPLNICISGQKSKKYYIPLATTEGALVASVNRGIKAINLSGGTTTFFEEVGATRGPVFKTTGLDESKKFKKWLDDNFDLLSRQAEKTSSHLKLQNLEVTITGFYVYIRFIFNTGEAMGMNMVTIATEEIVKIIEEKTKIKCLAISGNFCIDKKPGWLNFINGRGKKIWAETILEKKIINDVLKTSSENIFETWLAKCMIGSALSGSLGFNAHFANVIAAFFTATGQDLAHITEGSLGLTTMKLLYNGNLIVSVYLPDIMLGIVGGGTKLTIKKEALSIMKVKNTAELCTVLAGAVLAGEISLLASLSEGSLAKAHEKLGR